MTKGTAIGRVRGLGAAHQGTHHWVLQRYTAAGNLLAVTFLAVSLVLLPDYEFATVREWLARPLPILTLAALVISTFWHAKLGLQVLIEDYLHNEANKFAALLVLNLAAFGGILFGLLSLVTIAASAAGDASAAAVQDNITQALQNMMGAMGGMGGGGMPPGGAPPP